MQYFVIILLFFVGFIPLVLAYRFKSVRSKKNALLSSVVLCAVICISAFAGALTLDISAAQPGDEYAGEESETSSIGTGAGIAMLGAGLATGLSCVGAGIAVASAASAAIGAISENPSAFGKALIFVALGEGVALYGMLISIQILNKF